MATLMEEPLVELTKLAAWKNNIEMDSPDRPLVEEPSGFPYGIQHRNRTAPATLQCVVMVLKDYT